MLLPYIPIHRLSSHARWKSVEPALMDARMVTAVRNKTLHHLDDDNTIYGIKNTIHIKYIIHYIIILYIILYIHIRYNTYPVISQYFSLFKVRINQMLK